MKQHKYVWQLLYQILLAIILGKSSIAVGVHEYKGRLSNLYIIEAYKAGTRPTSQVV